MTDNSYQVDVVVIPFMMYDYLDFVEKYFIYLGLALSSRRTF